VSITEHYSQPILGTSVRYLKSGKGKPLVFIHPWLGTADNFLPIIEKIGDRFTCIALDLPGFGKTKIFPDRPHTIKNYVQLLTEFVKSLNLQTPGIIGASLGGTIALQYALIINDPAVKILAQSPVYKPLKLNKVSRFYLWLMTKLPFIFEAAMRLCKYKSFRRFIYLVGDSNIKSVDFEILSRYALCQEISCSPRAVYESVREIINVDIRDKIKGLQSEICFIYGSLETLLDFDYKKELLDIIPRRSFYYVKGGKHFLSLQKTQEFVDHIFNFFNTPGLDLVGKL